MLTHNRLYTNYYCNIYLLKQQQNKVTIPTFASFENEVALQWAWTSGILNELVEKRYECVTV